MKKCGKFIEIGSRLKNHGTGFAVHMLILGAFVCYCLFLAGFVDRSLENNPDGFENQVVLDSPLVETNNLIYFFDSCTINANKLEFQGWAFIDWADSIGSETYIILQSDTNTYVYKTLPVPRKDVTLEFNYFSGELDWSGFWVTIPLKNIVSGEYKIGLFIKKSGLEALQYTDRSLAVTGRGAEIAVRKSQLQELTLPAATTGNIRYWIDSYVEPAEGHVEIKGWAFIRGRDSVRSRTYIVLQADSGSYVFDTIPVWTPTVTEFFSGTGLNLDQSGFIARILKKDIPEGKYRTGIYIKKDGVEALQFIDINK